MTHRRRLDKLECSLTPTQAFLLWLEEAHGHGSLDAYVAWLKTQHDGAYPLIKLPALLKAAVQAATKGWDRKQVEPEIERQQRDVAFLFMLHQEVNTHVLQDEPRLRLAAISMEHQLLRLVDRVQVHHQMNTAWYEVCRQLPYPLDTETAEAVQASTGHHVETWDLFEESGTLGSWVEAAFVREGHTALPFWASRLRPGSTPPRWVTLTIDEVRACFKDDTSFDRFMAGEDHRYGLADVDDATYEARWEAADAAPRALVDEGAVEAGWVVELPAGPLEFLQHAPLVEGEWVDAFVVELAEYGALLQKAGFSFRYADDNSPFAGERIGREVDGRFVDADEPTLTRHSDAARTRLSAFPGRTKEIDGRRHLHLDAYERWKRRAVKGRLTRGAGFVTASWNAWVAGHPVLAGVPDAAITCYAAAEPFSVHEAADAARRQREREDLLAGVRRWSLHDFDQDGGHFARPLPLFRGDLRDEVSNWLEKAGLFAAQVYRLQAAAAQVGERYFDGAAALFPDVAQSLAQDAEIWEHAADLFQQCIAAQFEDAANVSDVPAPRFDLADMRAAGEQQAGELAEYLVDVAKAHTLRLYDDQVGAAAILDRHD